LRVRRGGQGVAREDKLVAVMDPGRAGAVRRRGSPWLTATAQCEIQRCAGGPLPRGRPRWGNAVAMCAAMCARGACCQADAMPLTASHRIVILHARHRARWVVLQRPAGSSGAAKAPIWTRASAEAALPVASTPLVQSSCLIGEKSWQHQTNALKWQSFDSRKTALHQMVLNLVSSMRVTKFSISIHGTYIRRTKAPYQLF
jgi:hypothetical protein